MGGVGSTFGTIGLIYLVGAAVSVYQLSRHWRSFWDQYLTNVDRQLAGGVAFFLLVPVGVLFHEFGHMLAAWSTGSHVLGLHYFVYWGYVEFVPARPDPLLLWFVALAGNLVSYLLGIGCLVVGLAWKSGRPALRLALLQLGLLELVQTLIFYPLISLDPSFQGDWDTIYSFQAPVASALTAVVHVASLVALVVFLRVNRTAKGLLGNWS